MKRILAVSALLSVLAFSASDGEWRMRVHRDATIDEFPLAAVDSVSFYNAPPSGMAPIPAGNVQMGQAGIAVPVHVFHTDAYFIGLREVTNAEFQAFMIAGGYTTEAWWNPVGWAWRVAQGITMPYGWDNVYYHGGGVPGNESFPVHGVSWWEADAYCRWAGRRLPTEAEWEKAAKGGCETHGDPSLCETIDSPTYPWGEGISGPRANYAGSGDPYDDRSTPVGYYDGGLHGGYQTVDSPSPYGMYDVAGNLLEWCSSRSAPYPYNPNDGRENPPATYNEQYRILRGGGWSDATDALRCARRGVASPDWRGTNYGFRCAADE